MWSRRVIVLVLAFSVVLGATGMAPAPPIVAHAAKATKKAKKHKLRRVCRRGERPHGRRPCVRAPRGAARPHGQAQQGGPNDLVPPPKGTGLGAGNNGFDREEAAITWARGLIRNSRYAWYCEAFVENAFNVRDKFQSAARAADQLGPLHGDAPPRGALVFFRPEAINRHLGHVGIALGNGNFISALNTVQESSLGDRYWKDRYMGWTRAPEDWLGRLTIDAAPDPGIQPQPHGPASIAFTSPQANDTLGGVVTLSAHTQNAIAVEFDAFYATNPADVNTLGWHKLGMGNTSGGGEWSLPYDTHAIPDQGSATYNTVNLAAVVVDGAGTVTNVRDYRRVDVSNAPPAQTQPPPPPPRRVITVDNRVTNGGSMREDSTPARLTTQPWVFCGSRGCNIAGTERSSGQTYDAAVCQTTGERTTNGNDSSPSDDANPERFESTRYYGVRLTNGTFGYVSEVWIRSADRGGLGLPGC